MEHEATVCFHAELVAESCLVMVVDGVSRLRRYLLPSGTGAKLIHFHTR